MRNISIYRKYDGYKYDALITNETPNTFDIQIPGFTRLIRFYRLKHDRSKIVHSVHGFYAYPEVA